MPFLPPSLPQGAPRHAAHQLQEPRFLPGGSGQAGIPAPARSPSRPAPNSAEGLARTRYSATGTALPPAGTPPLGVSSVLGHRDTTLGRRADTSAPAGPRPHVPGAPPPGRHGRGLWPLACPGGHFCPRRRHSPPSVTEPVVPAAMRQPLPGRASGGIAGRSPTLTEGHVAPVHAGLGLELGQDVSHAVLLVKELVEPLPHGCRHGGDRRAAAWDCSWCRVAAERGDWGGAGRGGRRSIPESLRSRPAAPLLAPPSRAAPSPSRGPRRAPHPRWRR